MGVVLCKAWKVYKIIMYNAETLKLINMNKLDFEVNLELLRKSLMKRIHKKTLLMLTTRCVPFNESV